MEKIDLLTQKLLEEVLGSSAYQDYLRLEGELHQDEALYQRVGAFRRDNFLLQQDPESTPEETRRIQEESEALRKNPLIGAYLDAELAVCKILQKISRTLIEGVDIHIPNI